MKKNKSYIKWNHFCVLSLSVVLLVLISSMAWAEHFDWSDYREPLSNLMTVCHNKSATITVNLPKDFLKNNKKITLSLEVESRTNTLSQKRPGFEDFNCYINIKGSFFGSYRIPAKNYPKRQTQRIEIKSKHLKAGQNTLKATFRWKNQNWSCQGSCCGYYIHQMHFPQVSSLQQSPVTSKIPYIPLLDANVKKMRFFKSGFDATPRRERGYKNRFSSSDTRYINWELNLAMPSQGRRVDFKIDAIWYRSDGSVLANQTKKAYIKPNWTNTYHSFGYGSKSRSWWLPGMYRVELYIEGEKVSSETFEVFGPQPQPTEIPILRLDTGMHTAALWKIDVDSDSRYLVTGSNDKTVRVWDLGSYKLFRTLRPPIGSGEEGRIAAVAISPDGKTIACGGRTGKAWEGAYSVYLFDRQNGKLLRRLSGFPGSIHHIVYSKDSRFLAVGYWKGIRVYRVPSYDLVDQDNNYGNRCSSVDFDPGGRLVTASYDGFIRLYDVTEKRMDRIAEQKAPSGTNLFSIKFSPDGSKIAVGYLTSSGFWSTTVPRVDVFSGKDLTYLYSPDISGIKRGLEAVAWSADGRSLYAGGNPLALEGKRLAPIFKWSDAGLGRRMSLETALSAIQDISPLKNGGIVFGAYNSTWGIFNSHGNRVFFQRPVSAEFKGFMNVNPSRKEMVLETLLSDDTLTMTERQRFMEGDHPKGFPISADAGQVGFSYEAMGRSMALFNIEDRSLSVDPVWDDNFVMPVVESSSLNITDWCGLYNPKLNGKRLQLSKNEISWCVAVAPDGNSFLLGTGWNLYHFNKKGKRIWKIPVRSVAWSVNISKNSRIAVLASNDGTIRWYRMEDGREILAFYPHADRKRWIAWTPEGYYMSSPYGDELIGWHLNNGKDREADFYSAVQFERILYRPDYVYAYFRHLGDRQKAAQVLKDKAFNINNLVSIAPPDVKIISPMYGSNLSSDKIRLKIAVEKRSLPMQYYTVFVNSIPVTPSSERILTGAEQDAFIREAEIPLFAHDNHIRVEVFNGTSMGLAETVVYKSGPASAKARGNLYLLSVGVNGFVNMPANNLSFAAADADNLSKYYRGEAGKFFNRVFAKSISDSSAVKPTKEHILKSLEFIKDAKAEDTVIVFLASHGLSDSAGNYYFIPGDASVEDVRNLTADSGRGASGSISNLSSLIGWETFFDALRSVPGKRLLVVDTCQAKKISGTFDIHSLAKRSATSSFALLAASKGDEESQEYPQGKQGLFTYALLKGLSGDGDGNGDGQIVLAELYEFIAGFVENNRAKEIGNQTPQLAAPEALKEMVLSVN